uniref:Amine oxidase domain-containing protein n=1 Tax=Eucampia antarctica TaxID=49252 RepID=A0A7S2RXV9_9STRA
MMADSNSKSKKRDSRNYFTTGSSWMKVSFPSAKDPSWNDRFTGKDEKISTCVVTIEADNDTCREFSTKPRIFSIISNKDAKMRLMDRVTNDLLDNFPQLKGKMKYTELHGPFRAGLSHTPERFAAKGVRPHTPYPGLYMGGSDLTMGNTFSGSIVAGWLVANAVIGYSFIDQMFLNKDIISDLVQFMDAPRKNNNNDNEANLAVPFNQPSATTVTNATEDKNGEQEKLDIHTTAESSKEE